MDIENHGIFGRVTLSEFAAVGIGFLYVSGYYINSMFIRNLGISHAELLRLEYIFTGFAFTLITLAFVFLPVGCFYLTYNVRRGSKLPHYHIGAIGNSINTALFLAFPVFLAFFATKYEWELPLRPPILHLTRLNDTVIAFLLLTGSGMAILPRLEREVVKRLSPPAALKAFRLLLEPLRYGIIVLSTYLMMSALLRIPWFLQLLQSSWYYFLAGIVLTSGLAGAMFWIRHEHVRQAKDHWVVYGLVAFGLAVLFYATVAAYVTGVYKYIPVNRGGRLPLTEAYLEITSNETLLVPTRVVGTTTVRGPVYIVEETSDSLFVASRGVERWLTDFVPIHAIRKENIPYIYLERIVGGFPRVASAASVPAKAQSIRGARHVLPDEFYEARRTFQYDYIYFDGALLLLWIGFLAWRREFRALLFGALVSPLIYCIDAVMWWNRAAGSEFSAGTFIREYWIGGTQVQHPLGYLFWPKFGADFMMTISYALFAFPWLVIMCRTIRRGRLVTRESVAYTTAWFGLWLLTPLLSRAFSIDDTPVTAVRHMQSQFPIWIANLFIGYGLLMFLYRRKLGVVGRVLTAGIVGALVMEVPLWLFGIRPTGVLFVVFEGFFLLNQGAPYLFILFDKVLPWFLDGRIAQPPAAA